MASSSHTLPSQVSEQLHSPFHMRNIPNIPVENTNGNKRKNDVLSVDSEATLEGFDRPVLNASYIDEYAVSSFLLEDDRFDQHLEAIKHTPFWLLVRSIMEEDEEILYKSTKKYEDDIRLLVRYFDWKNQVFRIGKRVLKLEKRDLEFIFGVRDGTMEVNMTTDFKTTPWMERCFPVLLDKEYTKRKMPRLKKLYIFTELETICGKDDKIHAQDVARLMHCYLLASLFMPDHDASIPWSLCEFLEEFSDICMFDWSSLVINQLEKQMVKTKTMIVAGCAMLLPYWLCEHTGVIRPRNDQLFPCYLRWDLNQLHQKISMTGLTAINEKVEITAVLKPTLAEKLTFRITEMQDTGHRVDTPTQTRNGSISGRENVMSTASKEATTDTVVPDITKSVPEINQTALLEIVMAENVPKNTELNEKQESHLDEKRFVDPSLAVPSLVSIENKDRNQDMEASLTKLSHDTESLLKTMTQNIDELKAKMSQEIDEVHRKLKEKEKLLAEVQCERDGLASSLTTQKELNAKQEQDLAKVRTDLLKKTSENKLLNRMRSERINELESEISTLKENLKSSQTKECDQNHQIKTLEKKCDDLRALSEAHHANADSIRKNFDAAETSYMEKITMMEAKLEEKNNALRETENQLSEEKQMTVKLESKLTELTHANEVQKEETQLQAYVEELGGELISRKESEICNLLKEGNAMADNAYKRNLKFGFSDAEYCKGKSKVIPGFVTRGDTSKPKPVTPNCKEVICLSDDDDEEEEEEDEFLPMMKESNRLSNSPYARTDRLMNFLKSRKGSVIWSGDGPFAKVSDGDALKVLNPVGLTSEIIDSWGELLVQNLNKKGKTTSTFIFTSRISEVVGRTGGSSSTIQEFVDSQSRRAVKSQILILPLFTSASKCTGYYWSLLKYDVKSSTWTVFSAMQPQSGVHHHFKTFLPLVEYVEERMLPALIDPNRNTQLPRPNKTRNNVPLQKITRPERLSDSGVVVCHIMETILKGHPISMIRTTAKEGAYRKSTAENYKFRMAETFCFPYNMKEE